MPNSPDERNHHSCFYRSRCHCLCRQFGLMSIGSRRVGHRSCKLHSGQAAHRGDHFVANHRFPPERIFRKIWRQLDFCDDAFSICRDLFFRLRKLECWNRCVDSVRCGANHNDHGGPRFGRKTGDIGVVGVIDRHLWSDLFSPSRNHRPVDLRISSYGQCGNLLGNLLS